MRIKRKIGALAVLGILVAIMLPINVSATDDFDWDGMGGPDLYLYDNTDDVGIGTQTPSHKLEISDSDTTANRAGLYVAQTGAISGTGYGIYATKTGASTTNVGGYFSASGATNNYGLIVGNGRIGIGDTSPDFTMEVAVSLGNGVFGVSSAAGNDGDLFKIDNYGDAIFNDGSGDNDFRIESDSDANLFFADASTDKIGIGTNTPDVKLDVEVSGGGAAEIGYSGNSATGDWAVAIGLSTKASGYASMATGGYTEATREYAFATGFQSSASHFATFAAGCANASGLGSSAIGWYAYAHGGVSHAMGSFVKANEDYSFVIGRGYSDQYYLENDVESSLIIGFHSTTPTFFVDGSSVGIGGTTTPGAQLDVGGSAVFNNDGGANNDFRIEGGTDANLFFADASADMVGIGTNGPGRKLDVLDSTNPQLRLSASFSHYTDFQTTSIGHLYINPSGGNVGIGETNPHQTLVVDGKVGIGWNDAGQTATLAVGGNVGISVGNPQQKLVVNAGNVGIGYNDAGQTAALAVNGGVGIGTITPDAKLEVESSDIQLRLTCPDSPVSQYTDLWTTGDGHLYINPSGGHVGIGDIGPDATLEIIENGSTPFMISNGVDGNGDFVIVDTSGKVGIRDKTPGALLDIEADTGTSPSPCLLIQGNNDYYTNMIVDAYGRVGFGGTPGDYEQVLISDTTWRSGSATLRISNPDITTTGYGIHVTSTGLSANTVVAGYFSASGATNNHGLIVENGNVGIGETTPYQKLIISDGKVGIGYNDNSQTAKLAVNGNVGIGTKFPDTKLHIGGTDAAMTLTEASSRPADPTAGTEANIFVKDDKLYVQFKDGIKVKYFYLDLTATTDQYWKYTITAP